MCGIVGYIGKQDALPIILSGLAALEYRGYDSAGIAVLGSDRLILLKEKGYVSKLKALVLGQKLSGTLGIGHTRWATHGEPSVKNAHPHCDCKNRFAVVHNGIIENYHTLKDFLRGRGHRFISETDTEVVPHLIEEFIKEFGDFKSAFLYTLKIIQGAYALAVVDAQNKDTLFAAKRSSPLVIGVGEGENFLASDPSALVSLTKKVIYLKDGEVAEITRNGILITDMEQHAEPAQIQTLEWTLEQAQKGDFPHFMLKEIFEGPQVIKMALAGRFKSGQDIIKLGGLESIKEELKDMRRLIIVACGTSYYAGLVGEYFFEEISKIPTEVHFASEFRYRDEPFEKGSVLLAISQSGETADTIAAIQKAKEKGLLTLGIVNVVGSTIARETDAGVYNHAGPEIGVASTKAFLSQLTILLLMSVYFEKDGNNQHKDLLMALEDIPTKIEMILKQSEAIRRLAEKYCKYDNFLFLGRRYNYPVALEGALKLKEISYTHAEGYGAGEMKHGPLALIDSRFPTMSLVPRNNISQKMISNLEEIKSRQGPVIAITNDGSEEILNLVDDVISIPETIEPLEPFLTVVPLHLFAYYMGVLKGYNVDKPRNLAKSVTVE